MKAKDVKIGGEYMAKIDGQLIHVRIVAEKPSGGWSAINMATGKKVLITMARVLQSEVANETLDSTTSTIAAKAERPARGRKAKAKHEKEPAAETAKLSQLDAAIKVLGEATEPLTTKQMVEAMATKNLWASPGGKTPHATLYSAILRELQTKGDAARFVKTDRGHFQLRSA